MKKIIIVALVVLSLVGGRYGIPRILDKITYARFVVFPPEIHPAPPADLRESQLQDIEYLRLYPEYDRSYDSQEKKAKFSRHLDAMMQRAGKMSQAEFELAVAKATAIAENGHTNTSFGARARRMNAVPVRFTWFEDGLRVVLARASHVDLLGARILEIEGKSPEAILAAIDEYVGGRETYLRYYSPLLMMSPALLHAAGLSAHPEKMQILLKSIDGVQHEVELLAEDSHRERLSTFPNSWLMAKTTDGWIGIKQPGDKLSIAWTDIKRTANYEFWPDGGLFVQVNQNYDSDDIKLEPYLNHALQEAAQRNLKYIVLDLRNNDGGSYSATKSFSKRASKFLDEGESLYIVTGNGTFSAAIMFAAMTKYYGGDKVVVVGEPAGDNLIFWANGGADMMLPNSGITVRIWTSYNDWKDGCHDWKVCFTYDLFDSVGVGSIEPDVTAPLRFRDFVDGEDTALKKIQEIEYKKIES